MAQFKSFVKVFVPGGSKEGREGGIATKHDQAECMAEESGCDFADESFCLLTFCFDRAKIRASGAWIEE